jgi:hypothetical protein
VCFEGHCAGGSTGFSSDTAGVGDSIDILISIAISYMSSKAYFELAYPVDAASFSSL